MIKEQSRIDRLWRNHAGEVDFIHGFREGYKAGTVK